MITLKNSGIQLEVQQATRLHGIRRAAFIAEADKLWATKPDDTMEQQLMKYDETILFPSLRACTIFLNGKSVETIEEFEALPEEDSEQWIKEASATNAHWFPFERSEPVQQSSGSGKKKRKRRQAVSAPKKDGRE